MHKKSLKVIVKSAYRRQWKTFPKEFVKDYS